MINSSRDQTKQKTSFYSQSAQQDAEDSANFPKWNCPARAGHSSAHREWQMWTWVKYKELCGPLKSVYYTISVSKSTLAFGGTNAQKCESVALTPVVNRQLEGKVSELWDEAEQKWWPLRVTTACSSALRPSRALSWLFKWESWSIWAWIDCVEAALL